MSRISDIPKTVQIAAVAVLAVLLTAALYFTLYRAMAATNQVERQRLTVRRAEVENLRKYENDLPRLNQQIVLLRDQLEIQKHILPDEQEADGFIHLMQTTAQNSGIEIRRWTAKPLATREYYTEVPFELELDGPYYGLLNFFQRVGQLERIINVNGLQLSGLKEDDAKFKHGYRYGQNETVAGLCTAVTFFSHDAALAAPATTKGAVAGGPSSPAATAAGGGMLSARPM